jgi:dihydroorotate dehydrogenase (fumarate)
MEETDMDLRTSYMGLDLKHPVVASASPLSEKLENIKRMEDAGAAAVVMFSLFEEQIKHENAAIEHLIASGGESYAESLSYFPEFDDYDTGPEEYLNLLRMASESVDIPVIGSLNGITNEGWVDTARMMQQAGARGIELNIYYIPGQLDITGREVEERYLDVLKSVKASVSIPVALKLSPFFSAMGNIAWQFDQAGADALVLFNRFYQPDFDLDKLEVMPNLELSTQSEIRLPLLWIAMLYGRINASLAATRGVHSHIEVIKYLMAGADVVMTTSGMLQNGIGFLTSLVDGLQHWMEEKQYESVEQMRGSMSTSNCLDPGAFERANYIKILESYKPGYE